MHHNQKALKPVIMALSLLNASIPSLGFITVLQARGISNRSNLHRSNVVQAKRFVAQANVSDQKLIVRRSANYHPPIWDHNYVQSLRSEFQGEQYNERANKLMREVRKMLDGSVDPLEKLELVDTLQRLGLSHNFEDEIKKSLKNISAEYFNIAGWMTDNLYATALGFRLLRQHGYDVKQDVFSSFTDEVGNFKESLSEDCKGMLNLYEASYLLVEGESILENARDFAAKHLREFLKQNKDEYLLTLVDHALELPLHWRTPRLEAKWFIAVYQQKKQDKNPILLELAILDFNMIQALHQNDLKKASNWWRNVGLGQKLNFARDRLITNFLWSMGMMFGPQFGKGRTNLTKASSLITIIDDVYDVDGTLDELEVFTEAVERWDINAIQRLPNYMKICFHALYNSINEMAFDTLKDQEVDVIPFLKKLWTNQCKAYLLEAKWYYNGYTPTLQEYIDNAWISSSGPVLLGHSYLVTDPVTKEGLQGIEEYYPNVIRWSSIVLRLTDDLGTSSDELKRGDVPKSIQCYMHESGASEEEARQHIRKLIDETWKRMNKDRYYTESPFSDIFLEIAMNLPRISHCIYQNGDGHGNEDGDTKDQVLSLFVNPIPLPK